MDHFNKFPRELSEEEICKLESQNSRLVTEFKSVKLEEDSRKNWDLFYKRNETRFFKDRHWTTREFQELLNDQSLTKKTLFEIGCGVGNFIFPLVEENFNFEIHACDLSARAIEFVKSNPLCEQNSINAFQTDITTDQVFSVVKKKSMDIATLIFVLSAIHPNKFSQTVKIIFELLKPGGVLLFRDYGLFDMAQFRFKPGHKISDNFYMRQDGTRVYYFSLEEVSKMFTEAGYEILANDYIHRRTVNKKENIDVPRVYVQSKVRKPFK